MVVLVCKSNYLVLTRQRTLSAVSGDSEQTQSLIVTVTT